MARAAISRLNFL